MIVYKKGNLLDVTDGIIAHGCNAQGVMGSGVALAVKTKYPEAYHDYVFWIKERKEEGFSILGNVCFSFITPKLVIANCITQDKYGKDGAQYVNYEALLSCFVQIKCAYPNRPLHIPKIGAGLGGGDWMRISKIISHDVYRDIPVTCWEL